MKTIGLIGGISWESSIEYYRIINEEIKKKLGGFHSAKCIMYSFDFAELEKLEQGMEWKELTKIIIDAAQILEKAEAELLVICANTEHIMADEIQKKIGIPLLNIIDTTAEKIKEDGLKKVCLLGTKFTMEGDFYKERLIKKHDIDVIIPDEKERQIIHDVIYKELCIGIIKKSSKDQFKKIIEN